MTTTSISSLRGPAAPAIVGWRGAMITFFRDPVAYMTNLYNRYGGVARFVDGGNSNVIFSKPGLPPSRTTVFAFSPQATYDLLSNTDLFYSSAFNGPDTPAFQTLSSSIFGMSGERHRQQRRMLLPSFHRQRVDAYREDMVQYTLAMLDSWQAGQTRDVWQEMQHLALRIVNKTLFGIEATSTNLDMGRLIQQWLNTAISPATLLRWNQPFTPYGKLIRLSDQLHDAMRALIAQKRAAGLDEPDILAMLIQTVDEDGARLTDQELVGHTSGLYIAGHETSANALSWTLFLLATHPQVQAALIDELQGELQSQAPSLAQFERLALLERVLKESLRLFPPASMLGRLASQPATLAGHELAAGTEVLYSPYITHRIPALFEHPNRFMPERWEQSKPSPYEYLPFSAGPRMCLGTTFALMELKIVLSLLLQRFRVEWIDGTQLDRNLVITLSPKAGLPMRIQPHGGKLPQRQADVRGNVRDMVDLAA